MKRLLTPILMTPLLLAGCSDANAELARDIEAWDGEPKGFDRFALADAIETAEGRAAIAAAVEANPLIDLEDDHLAYTVHGSDRVQAISLQSPGEESDRYLTLRDPVSGAMPNARILSLDLRGDAVGIVIEFDNDPTNTAEYDISITDPEDELFDIYTGEVINLDPPTQP